MIPKTIYQSWYTKNLHPYVQCKIDHFKSMNPDYTHVIYTDEEMDEFVNTNFEGEIAECYNRLNIIVAKVDFWRYLVLYKYGGIYLDMDSSIEQPLCNLIKEEDEAIITAEGNPDKYVQWALIFNKNHPILKRTIDIIVDNIKTNRFPNDIMQMTGPVPYSQAINEVHKELFNDVIIHSEVRGGGFDKTYTSTTTSYRVYGVDYCGFFCYKYPEYWSYLYFHVGKKDWRQEQEEKQLLKDDISK